MADPNEESQPAHLSSYRRADEDPQFLSRDELRAVRLQLEWLKPELLQEDEGIGSTIVVFGGARLVEPSQARARLAKAERDLAENPENPHNQQALTIAKSQTHSFPLL